MPLLDVSDIVLDPDFADTFTITRRVQTVDSNGHTVVTSTTSNAVGVVTIGGLQPFIQEAEYVSAHKVISVHCRQRLYDPTTGYQPDIITWAGDTYTVKKAFNWSRFGAGFYAAECELNTTVSAA